jgi:uncharacterized membrane protein
MAKLQEKTMSDKSIYIINLLAALGTGMVAGVFLAFSTFIMTALSRVPTANGISAMQMINITVINPIFMVVLFGSATLSLGLVYLAFRHGLTERNMMLTVGSALYLVGSIAVTMLANVPLNDALAAIDPQNSDSDVFWASYMQNWTFWNHVRGLASFVSSAAFMRALCLG